MKARVKKHLRWNEWSEVPACIHQSVNEKIRKGKAMVFNAEEIIKGRSRALRRLPQKWMW